MAHRHIWEENWKGQEYCEKCGILKAELSRYQPKKTPEKDVDFGEVLDFLFNDLSELHAWTSPATMENQKDQKQDQGIPIRFS